MKALITGINGQDGSYLAEYLTDLGYEVHGIYRRTSGESERLEKLPRTVELIQGDMTDTGSIENIIKKIKPDEIYNLAAQSNVGTSFDIPEYTFNVDALGVIRVLEAVRKHSPKSKVYQASTSELFGEVVETPQNEWTPFNPISPYAVAKMAAHYAIRNYRKSYNLFACSGILFNHESILKNSPIIVRDKKGMIDILPIEDMFRSEKHRYEGILDRFIGLDVWDGNGWTKIISGTCYKDKNKEVKLIQTVGSCYESTEEHIAFDEKNNEKKTVDWGVGDKVFKIEYPEQNLTLYSDNDISKFIGYVVGDGYIGESGRIRITGTDKKELEQICFLVTKQFGWTYRQSNKGVGKYKNCKNDIWVIDIHNDRNFGLWLRKNIYTESKEKRVPWFILNANAETKESFFDGYYLADGRKAGHENYQYKGFTTKSQTLCLGLVYIMKSFSKQIPKAKCEYRDGRRYYYVQLTSEKDTNKGQHLVKDKNQVIKINDTVSIDGWFFDIQTENQTFATGANLFKIHNSPRRGNDFVTKKITNFVSRLGRGEGGDEKLKLGNIDSQRDWGYAKEYVKAMHLMLQQDKPDDYVIATNEVHSVREFLEEAFSYIDKDWKEYVIHDSHCDRPSDVNFLQGDYSKAREKLGWEPKVKFKELVKIMMGEE